MLVSPDDTMTTDPPLWFSSAGDSPPSICLNQVNTIITDELEAADAEHVMVKLLNGGTSRTPTCDGVTDTVTLIPVDNEN